MWARKEQLCFALQDRAPTSVAKEAVPAYTCPLRFLRHQPLTQRGSHPFLRLGETANSLVVMLAILQTQSLGLLLNKLNR